MKLAVRHYLLRDELWIQTQHFFSQQLNIEHVLDDEKLLHQNR